MIVCLFLLVYVSTKVLMLGIVHFTTHCRVWVFVCACRRVECPDIPGLKLPLTHGSTTLVNVGRIEWQRLSYHTDRYLYPIGYTVDRDYYSMRDPDGRSALFTC